MYQYTKRVLTCASVTQRLQAASKVFIFLNNSWGIIINLDSIWLHAKVEASTFPLKARRGLYLINDGIGVWGHWELLGKGYCKCEIGRTRRWWHFWEARPWRAWRLGCSRTVLGVMDEDLGHWICLVKGAEIWAYRVSRGQGYKEKWGEKQLFHVRPLKRVSEGLPSGVASKEMTGLCWDCEKWKESLDEDWAEQTLCTRCNRMKVSSGVEKEFLDSDLKPMV